MTIASRHILFTAPNQVELACEQLDERALAPSDELAHPPEYGPAVTPRVRSAP